MRLQVIGCGMALVMAAAAPASTQDAKAAEILAAARKAIGNNKLDALKAVSVEASVQRNVGNTQMQVESEILLDLPDKYLRSDVSSGAMSMAMTTGFNGEKAIMPAGATAMPGGGMMIRMGGSAAAMDPHAGEKPTPEQQEQTNRAMVRNSRQDISRVMLGWFAMAHPSLNAQYTYVGEAESPDGKAYVIDVKNEDGFAARLFIDQNSKLPLMLTYKGRQGRMVTNMSRPGGARVTTAAPAAPRQLSDEEARTQKAERDKQIADLKEHAAQAAPLVDFSLFFEDWREVDGINFPHVIRRSSEGTTNEEWKINKVKVNPKIDAKKFAVETR
jgi:hypothetical protein